MTQNHAPDQSAAAVHLLLIGTALSQNEPSNAYLDEALTACHSRAHASDMYDALCVAASYKFQTLDEEGRLRAWLSAFVNADLEIYGLRDRDERYVMTALRDSLGYSLGLPDAIATGGTHHMRRLDVHVRSAYAIVRLLEGIDGHLLADI